MLDLLTRLVDKSLVVADEHAGASRYRLLETIRQYAREQLMEAGEAEVNGTRGRQLEFFLALARPPPALRGADRLWLARLEAEHDNLRAAPRSGPADRRFGAVARKWA